MGLHIPPIIALLFTVALIIILFRRDFRERPNVTGALWLPFIWMMIVFSRSLSEWLGILGFPGYGGVSIEEGSPLDAGFYFALIGAATYVLNKRRVRLAEFVRRNSWLVAFLLFCSISIVWSDFPLIAFKRWIKILGHPIMALILMTEPDPEEALATLMKRCAYLVLPLSILFIKYYPEWGRSFDEWSGLPMNNGIAVGKNMLGADCWILGLFFFWYWLQIRRAARSMARRNELLLIAGLSTMIWWLFSMAHSATSDICLLLGALTIFLLGRRFVDRRLVATYVVVATVVLAVAEMAFGILRPLIAALGRDLTLTGRTDIWTKVLTFHTNPIWGTGFESFWLGDRAEKMLRVYHWYGNQAHNGYLETYLTLGLIGLFLLIGWIIATFRNIRWELLGNFEWGRLRLGFLLAVVVYNWTEAAFKTLHPVWFAFYIISLDYPGSRGTHVEMSSEALSGDEGAELAYFPDGV